MRSMSACNAKRAHSINFDSVLLKSKLGISSQCRHVTDFLALQRRDVLPSSRMPQRRHLLTQAGDDR